MLRTKVTSLLVSVLVVFLASCAPGAQYTLSPDATLLPGTDIPQQMASYVANALTQTAFPASGTPIPGVATLPPGTSSVQRTYQNSSLGIQLSYPDNWYLQELASSADIWGIVTQTPAISITSFDPASPPHKLEYTDQTVSLQIRFQPIGTRPVSFDNWVEFHRQAALANHLDIFAEERMVIAGQPADYLSYSSGSGGMTHQVLTILNLQEVEINIEGNFELAMAVLDTVQSLAYGRLKPPDSDTPAAGICNETQGDPVAVVLGVGPDGLPKAGRCLILNPAQRIKLINQTGALYGVAFAEFGINLPIGDETLLDKSVGKYLALGVHFLPMGPELWVKLPDGPIFTPIPPPSFIRSYSNPEVGYKLGLPGDWIIDENGMVNSLYKEVIFSPPNAEPFIAYLSISLDYRTLDQIIATYAQYVPDALGANVDFHGYPGLKYTYPGGRIEYFITHSGEIFLIVTDRPNDETVQSILMSIQFTTSNKMFEVTLADNGKTINMNSGDGFMLNLGSDVHDWSVQVDNENVLGLEQGNVTGIVGTFRARAPGSAILTAYGNPKCINSTPPCLSPSILYAITVIVQ